MHLAHQIKHKHKICQIINCNGHISPSSVAVNSFAVMGVNTDMIQAGVLSRAKLDSIMPAKIIATLDIKEGNFKIQVLPVSVPENIAAVQ